LRFTDDLVRRLCAAILARWKAKGLIHPKASDDAILSRMTAEIHKDIQREAELDRDAEHLARQRLPVAGARDPAVRQFEHDPARVPRQPGQALTERRREHQLVRARGVHPAEIGGHAVFGVARR